MAFAEINITENNTAPVIELRLRRQGKPANLTGCTVTLILAKESDGTIVNAGHQSCTITNATKGIIQYDQDENDFIGPNTYVADVKVVHADTTVETWYDQLRVTTRDKIGG